MALIKKKDILPFHTILRAAVVWDIMLCWLVTHSWHCREGCWHHLHGDQRTIFCYYKDIVRKLLQNVSNKLPINKVSYGHLWVDEPNIWSMHDLHLAYQPHRADLLTPWLQKPGYTKATERSPMDGVDDRSEGFSFLSASVLPSSTQWLILTSKKGLVLLKVVATNIHVNWMATWLEDNTRNCVASRDWHTNFFLGPQYSNSNLWSSGVDWHEKCHRSHVVLLNDLQVQCQCPCPPQPWLQFWSLQASQCTAEYIYWSHNWKIRNMTRCLTGPYIITIQ